ncbi:poly-gamma-glutamate synthesis protein (capsule biosynthesis protein) [Sphingobium sp. AP50]|nr:poly-gamma-glutamate synthesis protein (capsule biosynthesis protein) [Sphingobium sp. AP50]
MLGPYRTSLDKIPPAFAQVAALIQQSDAAFANQEGSSFDLSSFKGATAAENGGGYPIHTLDTMRNLHAMGINLLSRANNHSTDWGLEGLTATDVAVNAIGFTHAGTGQSLDAARAPGILNTSKGAVALVATASTFPGMSPAGDPDRGAGARPGLNPLHVEPVTLVTTDEMQALGKIVVRGGYQGYDLPGATPKEVHLNEKLFRVSATPGLTFDVSDKDRAALLASVSTARARAGLVLFSIHAHETRSGGYEDSDPAEFLPTLFHDAIDKGASVVLRHGPHAIQGIEIYKGTPIFYGLGHLFFELPKTITIASEGPHKQTVTLPEKWWEATAATLHYKQGKLQQIRIYPLIINDRDGPEQGLPTLAKGVQAQAILKRIQERSQPYHTQIRISDDIAIIDQF